MMADPMSTERTSREVARLLLDRGAEVNARDIFGGTSLRIAKVQGIEDMAELLRAHGGKEKSEWKGRQ
jgi:ankyrin repeat protein